MTGKSKAKIVAVLESEEDEYVVERIVSKRIRGGKTEYLLKWKGWSE